MPLLRWVLVSKEKKIYVMHKKSQDTSSWMLAKWKLPLVQDTFSSKTTFFQNGSEEPGNCKNQVINKIKLKK